MFAWLADRLILQPSRHEIACEARREWIEWSGRLDRASNVVRFGGHVRLLARWLVLSDTTADRVGWIAFSIGRIRARSLG